MTLRISPRNVLIVLLSIIILLAAANLAFTAILTATGHDYIFGLRPLFDVNGEGNIPAWYSSLAIALCSALCFTVFVLYRCDGQRGAMFWLLAALVFQLMAFDEAFSVHEDLWLAAHGAAAAAGLSYFTWIGPAMLVVAIVALPFVGFVRRLDRRTAVGMVAGGAVYVFGAVWIEEFNHIRYEAVLHTEGIDIVYLLTSACEEFLEMLGIALFIHAVLGHVELRFGVLSFDLRSNAKGE